MLDDVGKEIVSEWKKKSKVIDEKRKTIRDRLDALRDKIRTPVTEWEKAEEDRVRAEIRAEEERLEAERQKERDAKKAKRPTESK
jgi:hypothetical protein